MDKFSSDNLIDTAKKKDNLAPLLTGLVPLGVTALTNLIGGFDPGAKDSTGWSVKNNIIKFNQMLTNGEVRRDQRLLGIPEERSSWKIVSFAELQQMIGKDEQLIGDPSNSATWIIEKNAGALGSIGGLFKGNMLFISIGVLVLMVVAFFYFKK